MSRWQAFLDSLTTPGGKQLITILMLLFITILMAIAHFTGHDPKEEGRLIVTNAFTALFSVLLSQIGSKTS